MLDYVNIRRSPYCQFYHCTVLSPILFRKPGLPPRLAAAQAEAGDEAQLPPPHHQPRPLGSSLRHPRLLPPQPRQPLPRGLWEEDLPQGPPHSLPSHPGQADYHLARQTVG